MSDIEEAANATYQECVVKNGEGGVASNIGKPLYHHLPHSYYTVVRCKTTMADSG